MFLTFNNFPVERYDKYFEFVHMKVFRLKDTWLHCRVFFSCWCHFERVNMSKRYKVKCNHLLKIRRSDDWNMLPAWFYYTFEKSIWCRVLLHFNWSRETISCTGILACSKIHFTSTLITTSVGNDFECGLWEIDSDSVTEETNVVAVKVK